MMMMMTLCCFSPLCSAVQFEAMIVLILRTDDELLHVTLFSWLLDESVNLPDRLIDVSG